MRYTYALITVCTLREAIPQIRQTILWQDETSMLYILTNSTSIVGFNCEVFVYLEGLVKSINSHKN